MNKNSSLTRRERSRMKRMQHASIIGYICQRLWYEKWVFIGQHFCLLFLCRSCWFLGSSVQQFCWIWAFRFEGHGRNQVAVAFERQQNKKYSSLETPAHPMIVSDLQRKARKMSRNREFLFLLISNKNWYGIWDAFIPCFWGWGDGWSTTSTGSYDSYDLRWLTTTTNDEGRRTKEWRTKIFARQWMQWEWRILFTLTSIGNETPAIFHPQRQFNFWSCNADLRKSY